MSPSPSASRVPPGSAEAASPAPRRSRVWRWIGGGVLALAAAMVMLVALWDWNWFRPLAESRASTLLGRTVTMGRLEVHPGRVTTIVVRDLHIANPAGFEGPDLAVVPALNVVFEAETWWRTRRIVVRRVEADHPVLNPRRLADGRDNWTLTLPAADPKAPAPTIGEVAIEDGTAHLIDAKDKADVQATLATGRTGDKPTLILDAKGTYAGQPITAHAVGGGLLSLGDAGTPYPIDASLANGETKITLKGTVRDPLALTGANLDLTLAGKDMEQLLPLTGIAIPRTPPYRVAGKLDFGEGKIKFSGMKGQIGSSDLEGSLELDPHGRRPVLTGALVSRRVDVEDLAGFIGATPGRTTTPGQTQRQVREVQQAKADPRLLPNTPVSVPKVQAADIHLTYRADRILGRNTPFDSLAVKMDIEDGRIRLHPMKIGMGGGFVTGTIDLNPVGNELQTEVDVTMRHVNLSRLLAASGLGSGQGPIDGTMKLKSRGTSFATILAHGDGELSLTMPLGGEVNALLIDLSGLELAPALLAALGLPQKETIRCLVADLALRQGILASRQLVVNTSEHIITGGGRADLSREVLELRIRTDPKHFTIGKLSAPIVIYGPFKNLNFIPDSEVAVRGAAAIGLGVLFPPAALLPTIQFGVGEQSPCVERRR